jgi:ribosomal protein S18 acetylase RimI-like enzyme
MGVAKVILEVSKLISLVIKLYKKHGYEKARERLVQIIEEQDDEKTKKYLQEVLNP